MSREIKFRAWHEKTRQMLHFSEPQFNMEYGLMSLEVTEEKFKGIANMPSACWRADEWVFMQFTGLHDKNGREIYEGDVWSWSGEIGVVSWFKERAAFCVKINDGYSKSADYLPLGEVIGNIHENPELLEKASK